MNQYPEADTIYSLLDWWEGSSFKGRGELCRSLACRAMGESAIPVEERRFMINCGLGLRRSRLSSGQERQLLDLFKSIVPIWPDFPWPSGEKSPPFHSPTIPVFPEPVMTLLPWQEGAYRAWLEAGKRGIIKAVTGSGKTLIALAAIRDSLATGGRAVVIVPTRALLAQWRQQLREKLGLSQEHIGLGGGGHRCRPLRQKVTIWVINSARTHLARVLSEVPAHMPILLIVDECHRAGSRENSRLFSARYCQAMGLSATPERQGDPGFEKILLPSIGDVVYQYDFPQALEDRVIPPFDLVNLGVVLSTWEREEYDRRTKEINTKLCLLMAQNEHLRWHLCRNYYILACFREFSRLLTLCRHCTSFSPWENPSESPQFFKFLHYLAEYEDDDFARHIMGLLLARKRLIVDAKSRLPRALELLKVCPDSLHTLVFVERIHAAEELARQLSEQRPDMKLGLYHSLLPENMRERTLAEFREGRIQVLISCRALDEGLDVPSVHMGVIVSSTSSPRQRIQRLGRILRKHPRKERSTVFNIYVRDTSERQLMFREFQDDGMDRVIGFYDPSPDEETSFINDYLG